MSSLLEGDLEGDDLRPECPTAATARAVLERVVLLRWRERLTDLDNLFDDS
jgi:hypothetical protein